MFDVIAVGELNNDYIFTGLSSLPVAGREIIAGGFHVTLGSSTAITASQLAKLGLSAAFCSLTGDDTDADWAVASLSRNGVDPCFVTRSSEVKTGLTVSLSDAADRALVTYKGAMDVFGLRHINLDMLKKTRHVHVGSFFLQSALREGLPRLFEAAHENGCTTSLDAGWDDTGDWGYGLPNVLAHTDYFFPNETEAAHITGEADPRRAAAALGARVSVVKCGHNGAYACSGGEVYYAPAYPARAIDTTGAGDCFNGGFLYAALNGYPLPVCLQYGNACGSVCVTQIGGASACADLNAARAWVENIR
jgi:sugar/nucleoside kinase (ribokinase family)